MEAYLIGSILGRIAVSYLIVWVGLFLICKFNAKQAFRKSVRWYGIVAVTVIFLLGVSVGLVPK